MFLLLSCKKGGHNLYKYNAKKKNNSRIESQRDRKERLYKIEIIRKVPVEKEVKTVDQ